MLKKSASLFIGIVVLTASLVAHGQDGVIQPSNVTLGPSQTQQFTLPTGQSVTWMVRPLGFGTVSPDGFYQAPDVIESAIAVYVYASLEGSPNPYVVQVRLSPYPVAGQTTSSNTLGGTLPGASGPSTPVQNSSLVSVSVSPASTYLYAGQARQFTAAVQGTANSGVLWQISPNVGAIVNGLYTAPAAVGSESLVTVSATSVADPSQIATATVLLGRAISITDPGPPNSNVQISLGPGFAVAGPGQSVQFTATVSGATNPSVTWALNPAVGTLANGLYTAPNSISTGQVVAVIATSVEDPSKSASVGLVLQAGAVATPTVGISISPGGTTLAGGQTASFTPSVSGTSNAAVMWSLTPPIGTISGGVYQAPAIVGSAQAVTISATSVADPTKIATATVSLVPVAVSVGPVSAAVGINGVARFTASVSGSGNTAVTWSRSPERGSVGQTGVYEGPPIITNPETITVTATSTADPTKIATATVSLVPYVSITVGPSSVSLGAGGSATFTPTVSGTSNTAVAWSLSPQLGTIANGVYTAPGAIPSPQTVTLIATSAADSTKTAIAQISLVPAVSVTVAPASLSLGAGQTATFTASVGGSGNTSVTWSLNPQVGTVTNGVYTAPGAINGPQTVTLIATSAADSTKTATAQISLVPVVSVTVAPASVSLGAGQSATFTASVAGSGNTSVTWSVNPQVGTVANNGVYTAPATISSAQTVTLTAVSAADSTQSATATISLTASPAPPSTTVTLPLEVIGPDGTTVSASVTVPNGANLSGQQALWMQIHGLRSETQASVQVNNSGWVPITSGTVSILGSAAAYGGIGGGFSTLKMTMALPAGVIQSGANTISFRFNQTDGRVSGFRVLAFNIQATDGSSLIPASAFVNDDPNNWQPPSTNASDIAAGQALWEGATLTTPVGGGSTQIQAHCSDCHTHDGRDLKYFNYSNNSIQSRALFHGLTAQQGDQISSYIRNLNVVNPGRPWNPPYQPGPGLDSQPVINWAAGAGVDAVVDTDQDMINAMFPSGYLDSVFAATSRLNQRETPLPLQLPDWNQWLPGTHPMDAFGSAFTNSAYNTAYQTLASNLSVSNASQYAAQKPNFDAWYLAYYYMYEQAGTNIWNNPNGWTSAMVDAMYSLPQWGMVKNWELMNQFQLEGLAQNIFGAQADARAWYSPLAFDVAPHELKMPSNGAPGLRNGSKADYIYLSYIWYQLQLILNDSNGTQQDHQPIDWGYSNDFVQNLGTLLSPQAGIQTMWMIKGLQISQQSGTGPQLGIEGWQPFGVNQIALLVDQPWGSAVWSGSDPSTRTALAQGILKAWLNQVNQFTPQQFYAGAWTTASATPVPGGNAEGSFPDMIWYSIPRFEFLGVDPGLVGQWAQWAQTMWPLANWNNALNATCIASPQTIGQINCSQ